MADLKKSWQQTAKSFILAINDLSASVIDTAKAGYDVAMEWAKKDNVHVQTDGAEIPAADKPSKKRLIKQQSNPRQRLQPNNASM